LEGPPVEYDMSARVSSVLVSKKNSTYGFKYDLDHQTATRAHSDVFTVHQICKSYLEPVATRTWIMVDLESWIVCHVLNFDFIIDIFCHAVRVVETNV